MDFVVSFVTDRFDPAREPPNESNPIPGQALLHWLRERLSPLGYVTTEPATEDWGWYMDVRKADVSYMVGSSGEADGKGADVDWTIQVEKHRSLKEKLLGRNKLTADDPLWVSIKTILRAEREFRNVEEG